MLHVSVFSAMLATLWLVLWYYSFESDPRALILVALLAVVAITAALRFHIGVARRFEKLDR
jgi:hypothetical protein